MKRRSDEEISAPLYAFDAEVRSQYGCFAGVDEAGRGPLCGPVCVAACILDPENPVYGINDSKKLTEKKREALFDEICEKALAYRIVFVGPEVIDRENILNATMGGMQQAVEAAGHCAQSGAGGWQPHPRRLADPGTAGGQGRCHQRQHRRGLGAGQGQP